MGWNLIQTTEPLRETIKQQFGESYGYMHLAHAPHGECYVLARISRIEQQDSFGIFVVLHNEITKYDAVALRILREDGFPHHYGAPPAMIHDACDVEDCYDSEDQRQTALQWRTFCMVNAAGKQETGPL